MHTGILAGAIACALAMPVAAHAQQAQARPLVGGHGDNVTAFIAQHDGNADGKINWAEFDAFRRARFDATDADRNGTVDIEEYVREFAARRRASLVQERASQVTQTKTRFDALDTDKDGSIARDEFDASGERVFADGRKVLAALDDGSDAGLRARDRNALVPSSHTAEGFLALYDANQDGQVPRGEFDARRSEQFARTDADKDGMLAFAEYLAEFEARIDTRMADLAKTPDNQTRVRFGALDADKDARMTFAEYQVSGKRLFDGADRSKDGIVNADDAKLPPPAQPARAGEGTAKTTEKK